MFFLLMLGTLKALVEETEGVNLSHEVGDACPSSKPDPHRDGPQNDNRVY